MIKEWSVLFLLLSPAFTGFAQEKKHLEIDELMALAARQSTEAQLLDAKVNTRKLEYQNARMHYLPDAKISGTYMGVNSPKVDMRIPLSGSGQPMNIETHQIMFGQATLNLPIYSGGKIRQNIEIAKDAWQAEHYTAIADKQNLSFQALSLYLALYKAQESFALIKENIKRAEQRVTDFKAMEENGVIARNDLLKAQLQLSNYNVALKESEKNINVITYQLKTLLKLDNVQEFDTINLGTVPDAFNSNAADAIDKRYEAKAAEAQQHIAERQLKLAKSSFAPTLYATGGYIAADIQNVVSVYNALNGGVGLSYDLGALYKNSKSVKAARSRLAEVEHNKALLNEHISVQVNNAEEDAHLAREQIKLYEEALYQSSENYRITKDKYDNGVADTDDLLEADVQQLQSRINLAIAKANLVEKYYNVLLANGRLNIQ